MTHISPPTSHIIGVLDNGPDGLSPAALGHIARAHLIIGAHRTLALFEEVFAPQAEQRDLSEGLTKVPQWIETARAQHLRVVVLATGDPLCHGIGRYLIGKLGPQQCEVIPNVSTLQLAFARLGLAWQNAAICSAHSKDAGEWSTSAGPEHGLYPVLQTVRGNDLTALFTSPENSPDRIARMLLAAGLGEELTMSVAEKLSTAQERIIPLLPLAEAATQQFADPNVVILQRRQKNQNPAVLFGLADQQFAQRKPDKGLITKREVRAVSLARLQLRPDSIVWDIGAGSGSVGLEAARLCHRGFVYAIEKNEADVAIACQNRQQMAITNYRVQHGKAPEHLANWPNPDAVFIGGSGGELGELIQRCLARMKADGWLVMNFVTLENLSLATDTLKALNAHWDVTQLQANRSQPILHMHRMAAENPVWIVSAQRGDSSE